jgi:hypothetical protein
LIFGLPGARTAITRRGANINRKNSKQKEAVMAKNLDLKHCTNKQEAVIAAYAEEDSVLVPDLSEILQERTAGTKF